MTKLAMAENNKFQEFMNSLLNIKAVAIIAVAGAVFAALVSFLKTANEGYDMVFKKPDVAASPVLTKEPIVGEDKTETTVNDTLIVKGKVDLFKLINELSIDNTEGEGMEGDWKAQADNPYINWVSNPFDYDDRSDTSFTRCGPKSRTGYCVLTNDGKPIYTDLDKRITLGAWQIKYCGPNAGVYSILISSWGDGSTLKPRVIESVFKGKCKLTKISYRGERPYEDYTAYELEFPKKNKLSVTEYDSFGSQFGSVTLKIEFDY